jgi:hypothetical protein
MTEHWEFGDEPGTRSGAGPDPAAEGRADATGAGTPAAEPPASTPEPATAFPWPPAEGRPVLPAFGATWREATFDPATFFRRVPREGGTGAAFVYFLALAVLVAGVALFWDSLSVFAGGTANDLIASELGTEAMDPLVGFLLTPGMLAFGLVLWTAITHVLLLLFGGATHGFGTSFRVFCYAYAPALFGVVPLIGPLVGAVWMVVLLIIGLREAHGTDGWRPALAVLVPVFLTLTLAVLGLILVAAAGAALLGAAG